MLFQLKSDQINSSSQEVVVQGLFQTEDIHFAITLSQLSRAIKFQSLVLLSNSRVVQFQVHLSRSALIFHSTFNCSTENHHHQFQSTTISNGVCHSVNCGKLFMKATQLLVCALTSTLDKTKTTHHAVFFITFHHFSANPFTISDCLFQF
jgi:hypothetical protein